MFKAYERLHEAVKRLLILGLIFWWAYLTNGLLNTYVRDPLTILINYLGPPVAILIIINIYFLIKDRKNKS